MDMKQHTQERLGLSLEQLNARIARLAMGLGVTLDEPHAMERLLERPRLPPGIEDRRKRNLEAGHVGICPERRTAHLYEELRGLLVMRYQIEAESVSVHGLERTHEILSITETHLEQQGFKPGADGISLSDFAAKP